MRNIYINYVFWLVIVSLFCLVLERVKPWRKDQKLFRPELTQDLFWLFFNGYGASLVFSQVFLLIFISLDSGFLFILKNKPSAYSFIASFPLILQVVLFLVIADFIEWFVHNLLHRNVWLWKIHRVHHSIKIMDWIGNFRFHWGELFVYKTIKYLPLVILGAGFEIILICSVIATLIGHLNHSNLNISWGPLRYVFNSPRMHIWHHERNIRGKAGVNFGVVFSLWDWIFKTAYMPMNATLQPEKIGFLGDEKVSHNLFMRFFLPFIDKKIKRA